MKTIYFDTEFSEGFFKPISWLPSWIPGNKPVWSIELISIGMVDDAGKEYYAVNKNFRRGQCNQWVKENVLTKLPERMIWDEDNWYDRHYMITEDDSTILTPNPVYKSLKTIKQDIINFVAPPMMVYDLCADSIDFQNCLQFFLEANPIQFKAYYADYDWVLFCSIFGTMIDLPRGFPKYCYDLKQRFDEYTMQEYTKRTMAHLNNLMANQSSDPVVYRQMCKQIRESDTYPKQNPDDEHGAISDARWNKQLDLWLNSAIASL